jgi:hypothetical protein
MKAYLRIHSNYAQDNWVSLLPKAQLAYNSKLSESIGLTSFSANHGRHPKHDEKSFPSLEVEAAMITAEELQNIHWPSRQTGS